MASENRGERNKDKKTYLYFQHFFRQERSGTPSYCTLYSRLIPPFFTFRIRDPFCQMFILQKEVH